MLGTGSFGAVYRGEIQGITVAVKVLSYKEVQAVRDELLASMALSHCNLVQTYMAFQQPLRTKKELEAAALEDPDCNDPFAEMMTLDLYKQRLANAGTELPGSAPDWEEDLQNDYDVDEQEGLMECFIVQVRPLTG